MPSVERQNDGQLWIVDDEGDPVRPVNIRPYKVLGIRPQRPGGPRVRRLLENVERYRAERVHLLEDLESLRTRRDYIKAEHDQMEADLRELTDAIDWVD